MVLASTVFDILGSVPALRGDREHLTREAADNWIRVNGGTTLFSAGDAPDYFYFVVCGRLEVAITLGDGSEVVTAHIGRGGCVGQSEILTGEPRATTVRAVRDTQLARLSAAQFEILLDRYPQFMRQIAKASPRVARDYARTAARNRIGTIAFVPAQSHGLPSGFADRLVNELSRIAGPAMKIDSRRVDHDLGQGSAARCDDTAHTRLISRLAEYEERFPYLLLECDTHLSAWTALCIRQADLVLVVGQADGDAGVGAVEAAILSGALGMGGQRKELVLVHSNSVGRPAHTSDWLSRRRVDAHHHVRGEHAPDYQRLARFIANKAVGLVLGGGGARGIAHIGAIQALEQCGVPIDFVGGTSMGAAVAAHWAIAADVSALTRIGGEFSNNFSRHIFREQTLPFKSLNTARRFTKFLQDLFGDVRIEDLWIPYFCTSANLSKAEIEVHEEGPLWKWVRASSSIPGIWPPVIRNGHLLVDGGVMNNLPIDVMRKRCRGEVIAVDVSPSLEINLRCGFNTGLSGWRMLWRHLNPFGVRVEVPNIFGILYRAAQLGSIRSVEAIKQQADLYLHPPTMEIDLFDWKSSNRLVTVSYQHCLKDIGRWKLRKSDELYGSSELAEGF
jgi:predicted acylesterase/phospholipase RssA/CRP-like cAMP-binding protein